MWTTAGAWVSVSSFEKRALPVVIRVEELLGSLSTACVCSTGIDALLAIMRFERHLDHRLCLYY